MNIIFVSELAEQALIDYLKSKGSVVLVPKDERFDDRISSHPDLVLAIIDDTLVIDAKAHKTIFEQLDQLGVPYVTGNCTLAAAYPMDIAYNAVITKDYYIHRLDCSNNLLLLHSKYTKKQLLPVKQGYTKCSTVLVDQDAIITSDPGIYQATKDYMKVLLIEAGHVSLEGFDFGFLGGASGSLEEEVIFHGDLKRHPDFAKIKAFIESCHKKLVYFQEFPLTDIGSILVFPYQQDPLMNEKDHKHVNIPIFISHEGCPNDCVFCNQRKITAKAQAMTLQEVSGQIETYCSTLEEGTFVELAFFGGSFTGIDARLQKDYLSLAYEYKKAGRIQAIRLSTRPDYINEEILKRLKRYEVDTIELGVQSLQEEVLMASNRGHLLADVYEAVALIKAYGFRLGIQLMVGLPQDNKERSLLSAKLTALLKPDFVRIYPTLVIKETELLNLCQQGKYQPLSLDMAVDWTKEMYKVFLTAQIPVIRMGLQPTDLIAEGKEVLYGPFHPAFRQLVESAYFLELMKDKLSLQKENAAAASSIRILCHPKDLSQVVGHKRRNIIELKKEYPNIRIAAQEEISPMTIACFFETFNNNS